MLNTNLTKFEQDIIDDYLATLKHLEAAKQNVDKVLSTVGAIQSKYTLHLQIDVTVEERDDLTVLRSMLLNDTDDLDLRFAICKSLTKEIVKHLNQDTLFTLIKSIDV